MATEKTKKKRGRGQPPSFETVEQFANGIKEYLKYCEENKLMPNRAGLCVYLNISRDTYYEYKKKKDYSDTIKRLFEEATETIWVQRLGGNSPTGAIFYLKNAFREDYKDRHDTDITSGGKPIINIDKVISDKNATPLHTENHS